MHKWILMKTVMLIVSISLLGSSCAIGTATIIRDGKSTIEAEIIEGRSESVLILDDETNQIEIPRSEIVDIDHPGTFRIIAGIGITAIGALLIYASTGLFQQNENGACDSCLDSIIGVPAMVFSISTTAVGLGSVGYGIWEQMESESRYRSKGPLSKTVGKLNIVPNLSSHSGSLTLSLPF